MLTRRRMARTSMLRWAFFAISGSFFLLTLFVAFVPLTGKPLTIAVHIFAPSLMATDSPSSPVTSAVSKIGNIVVQQGMLEEIYRRTPKVEKATDVQRIGELLVALKRTMISQSELRHKVEVSPLLAGLGWCDQINGLGAMLLAREFSDVAVMRVAYKNLGYGHSFGRIRLNDGRIVYFDVWTDDVSVFEQNKNGPVNYAFRATPFGLRNFPDVDLNEIAYFRKNASKGIIHNRLQSTPFGYFFHRLGNLLFLGTTYTDEGNYNPASEVGLKVQQYMSQPFPTNDVTDIAAWTESRLAHVRSDDFNAIATYRQVAKIEKKSSVFKSAANIFVDRLGILNSWALPAG